MNRGRKYKRGIEVIRNLVVKTENLLRRSNYHMVRQGSTPIEPLKNYCLKNIEALNKLNRKALNIPDSLYDYAKKKMFDVYFELQDYRGTERSIVDNHRELALEDIINLLDEYAVESYAAESRSGGLGFSSINGATLYISEAMNRNEYWKPPKKRGELKGTMVGSYGPIEYKPKQTIEAWRDEMALQKKEVMDEVYRLQ
jgi:hypothetical protein|tara:strand:+ start:457 stop:1053 length:597 start_codon:yes stop_codon:yes gene_type:complete